MAAASGSVRLAATPKPYLSMIERKNGKSLQTKGSPALAYSNSLFGLLYRLLRSIANTG